MAHRGSRTRRAGIRVCLSGTPCRRGDWRGRGSVRNL